MRRLAVLLLVLAPCVPGSSSPQHEHPTDRKTDAFTPIYPLTPGHEKMLELLRDIRDRAPHEHFWLGDQQARPLRERWSRLRPDQDDFTRFELYLKLGEAEQRLGREQEAIDYLTMAYELLPSVERDLDEGIDTRVMFNLGVAHMRRGETQNCAMGFSPDACLLPIRGSGVHVHQESSRNAIRYFQEALGRAKKGTEGYLSAIWLLNISYMTIDGYPEDVPPKYLIPPKAFESDEPFPVFTNVAHSAGVDKFDLSGGVVAEDFDRDGHLDLLVSSYDPAGQLRLFINDEDGTFSERTTEAGLTGLFGGLNMVQGDYDNDGDPDVLVLRGAWMEGLGRHPRSLLRNQGDGTFMDVSFEAGLADFFAPTQTASWGDYDNDGDLDLYIGNESSEKLAVPNQLMVNRGDGSFEDVALAAGVTNDRWTKGVVFGDYDSDRFPDLYLSNLGAANRLYHNNRDGTFTDVAPALGVTGPLRSFPTWFWDFDNDGNLDIYVAAYNAGIEDLAASYLGLEHDADAACLYRGDGRGGFQEVATERYLGRPSAPMGANFGDLDNDGYLDFYLGTGAPPYFALMPNLMYRNRGGDSFADVTTAGRFGNLQKGHAVTFADLDGDGDQDIFEDMGGALAGDRYFDALYENPGFGNHFLVVELTGVQSNRSAIGARIRVQITEGGGSRSVYKHVNSGGSFGANPFQQTIGLGSAERIELLEVYWPTSDRMQTFRNVPLDGMVRIREGVDRLN